MASLLPNLLSVNSATSAPHESWLDRAQEAIDEFRRLVNDRNHAIPHGAASRTAQARRREHGVVDWSRLRRERRELPMVFGEAARPLQIHGLPDDRWEAYGAELQYGRFTIRGTYPSDYPYREPMIRLSPPITSRHYFDRDGTGPSLCYLHPAEWSLGWTLATSLGLAERFLNHLAQGLTD
jgi:hypothetical protein